MTLRLSVCVLLSVAAQAAAVERTFSCRNWIGRDWPRTLLHYDIESKPGEFMPGKIELVDSQGTPVESQVVAVEKHPDGSLRKGRVSFYADLKKDAAWTFTLKSAAAPKTFPARVAASQKDGTLEVTSAEAGVRLPTPDGRTFQTPADPKDVPAPILGWRLANGQWVGKTWLESDRRVTGWSQRVVADGPLYKEYAYEVRFVPGAPPRDTEGYYRVRVRVEAEQPLVFVAEEFDFGCATPGKDCFVMVLNDGLKADTAVRSSYSQPPGSTNIFQIEGIDPPGLESDTRAWKEPLRFAEQREHTGLYPSMDWGLNAQWYGVFAEADTTSPFVGLVTLHTGAWRLATPTPIVWTKDGRVLVRFRTSIHLQGEPRNPFSTLEIDPDLPQSLGRRMWALALGPRPGTAKDGRTDVSAMRAFRCNQGFVSLDDYKDWQLTWPEKRLPRPRVIATPESLARLKANLDRCPGRQQIKDFSLLTGDAATALAEAKRADHWLNECFRLVGRIFYSHYRQTQNDYEAVWLAESALASPAVTGELRQRLRAKIAARCYLLSNADFNPRGAAVHMGNPNMAVNRFMGLPLYAQLIADHPRAKTWLDEAYTYAKWKTSFNVTSGGGTFRENPGYATYGPTIFLSTAAIALRNAGYDIDAFEPLKDIGRYFRDIETPACPPMGIANMNRGGHVEAQAGRHVRVLPAFGNGQHIAGGQTQMLLASLAAKSDPAFAAEMMQSFQDDGGYLGTEMDQPLMWLYWNPDIGPKQPIRKDRIIAGFGGVLRAHHPHPEETYVCLRNGYTQSHWSADQGTLVLYSRGACISPATGWGYNKMEEGICRDSRISFGEPAGDPEHGRVDTNIEDYGSLPSLGYLLGRQTFKQRWDPTKTLKADFEWSRQVILLKSPRPAGANYVVVRDTTQGASPLKRWWYQWFVTADKNLTPIPGGVRAAAIERTDVKVDLVFMEPAKAQVAIKGLAKAPRAYEGWDFAQICVRQEPEKGYLAVFYPSRGHEPGLSKAEKLAEGVAKVTTPESVDYVFCAVEQPIVFKDDLVEINAFAGAVRIFKDKVLLVNGAGQFGSVGYKGVKAEGLGPFEHTTTPAPAKAETIAAGRKLAAIAKPEGTGMSVIVDGSGKSENPDVTASGLKGWILIQGEKVVYAMAEGSGKVGYKGFCVKGEAPFLCVHEPGKVTLTADGRRRIFQMPIPENLVPAKLLPPRDTLPEYVQKAMQAGWTNWPWAPDVKVDGISVQGGWYDGLMTVGLDEGKHTAVIAPYTNPSVWKENAFTRLLP